jgi:hypothetical protein
MTVFGSPPAYMAYGAWSRLRPLFAVDSGASA